MSLAPRSAGHSFAAGPPGLTRSEAGELQAGARNPAPEPPAPPPPPPTVSLRFSRRAPAARPQGAARAGKARGRGVPGQARMPRVGPQRPAPPPHPVSATCSERGRLWRPQRQAANFVPSGAGAIPAKFVRPSPLPTCAGDAPARAARAPGPRGAARSPGRTGESPQSPPPAPLGGRAEPPPPRKGGGVSEPRGGGGRRGTSPTCGGARPLPAAREGSARPLGARAPAGSRRQLMETFPGGAPGERSAPASPGAAVVSRARTGVTWASERAAPTRPPINAFPRGRRALANFPLRLARALGTAPETASLVLGPSSPESPVGRATPRSEELAEGSAARRPPGSRLGEQLRARASFPALPAPQHRPLARREPSSHGYCPGESTRAVRAAGTALVWAGGGGCTKVTASLQSAQDWVAGVGAC
ncbi:translation initiation factor IF-2-like [Panthera pardus]|uniref:Translation initiation factor IF-2-like n=1 Tax=Panthera pardus TaxID=9691 RepID=A0A9W2VYA9_PANPR|nr:translation initiation factor IF-2-like [Panthera pardus]